MWRPRYLDELKDCESGRAVLRIQKPQNAEQLRIEAAVSKTQQETAEDGNFFAE